VRITVIVPTYGRPRYLTENLRSIADQTRPADEVIVVDDCSDPPVHIPDLGLPLKVVRHARNMGPGAARNTGLAHATGDLVLFLDDDDLLTPRRLELAVNEIGDRRAHAAAYQNLHRDGGLRPYGQRFKGDLRATFTQVQHPATGQVVHHREDVVQFDPSLRIAEDKEWWLRMTHAADFAWSDAVGLTVRLHDEERPGLQRDLGYRTHRIIALRHARTLDRRSRARLYAGVAAQALVIGQRSAGLGWAARSTMVELSVHAAKLLALAVLPHRFIRSYLGDP
jgi:glycosyltransferase involved in cell wall biosynthesis